MATNPLAHRTQVENWLFEEEFEQSFENTEDEMRGNRQSSHQAGSVRVPPATAFGHELKSKPSILLLGNPIGGGCEDTTIPPRRAVFVPPPHIQKKCWNVAFVTAALLMAFLIGVRVGMSPSSSSATLSSKDELLRRLLIPDVNELSESQLKALSWLVHEDNVRLFDQDDADVLKERFALVSLYFATEGDKWTKQLNFLNVSSSVCGWNSLGTEDDSMDQVQLGVYCHQDGSASHVYLAGNNLQGTLPIDLGLLSLVSGLYFSNNAITGKLPSEIGLLRSLDILSMSRNEIGGSIPSSVGNLQKLTQLRLGSNALTGSIPSELFALSDLTVLEVSHNYIVDDLNDILCSRQDQANRSLTVRAACAGDNPMVQCRCCTCS